MWLKLSYLTCFNKRHILLYFDIHYAPLWKDSIIQLETVSVITAGQSESSIVLSNSVKAFLLRLDQHTVPQQVKFRWNDLTPKCLPPWAVRAVSFMFYTFRTVTPASFIQHLFGIFFCVCGDVVTGIRW